jgi:hypothetical protein
MYRLAGLRMAPVLAATVLAASLAGCAQVDATLSRQSAGVTFRKGTSAAVIAQIANQCRHMSGIEVRQVHGADARVTGISLHAGTAGVFSRRQLSDIYSCLGRFPAVTEVSVSEVNP